MRSKHPIIGGALLSLFPDPQTTRSWMNGAEGERVIGRRLDSLADRGVIALHDRKIPRSRSNIDHIAIGPSGIYVVDAKYRVTGRVETKSFGLSGGGAPKLIVGRRDCTPLVDKMSRQVQAVEFALSGCPEGAGAQIHPVIAFVHAEWGLLPGPIEVRGVCIVWPKELTKRVGRPGPASPAEVGQIAAWLSRALRPA